MTICRLESRMTVRTHLFSGSREILGAARHTSRPKSLILSRTRSAILSRMMASYSSIVSAMMSHVISHWMFSNPLYANCRRPQEILNPAKHAPEGVQRNSGEWNQFLLWAVQEANPHLFRHLPKDYTGDGCHGWVWSPVTAWISWRTEVSPEGLQETRADRPNIGIRACSSMYI